MDKEQAVELLKSHGIDAEIRNGILYANIKFKSERDLNQQTKRYKELLENNGYKGAFGWTASISTLTE